MPITLPLYGVIFDKEPQLKAKKEANEFFGREKKLRELIKGHIREELERPKQKISRIFKFRYPDEYRLREYLQEFVKELEYLEKNA